MVHRLLVEQRGQHRHEPFLEEADKEVAVLPDVYGGSQPADVVGGAVPGGQGVHILAEGVVQLHEVRFDDGLHVLFAGRGFLLAQASSQRVHLAVRQVTEILRSFGSELIFARHRVLAEASLPGQEGFDDVHGGFSRAVGRPLAAVVRLRGTRAVFVGALVARAQYGGHVAVVVGKVLYRPVGSRLPVGPVGIEQVAHAHDVFVVVVGRVGHALVGQHLLRRLYHTAQLHPLRLQPGRMFLRPWLRDGKLGGKCSY